MQQKIAVIAFLLVAAVSASPVPDSDWQLIPDSDGSMHMVDVKSYTNEIAPMFNPWNDVRFLLFTRDNPFVGQQIILNNAASLASSYFVASRQTRFMIHGWNSGPNGGVNLRNTAAWLGRGDFNVIVVDWSIGASANYIAAQSSVSDVGTVCGAFVDFLNVYGAPFSAINVNGHSLGAHVAGICGKRVTRGRLASIVALDPALPLFSANNPAGRVDSGDAIYVEIIHTDIGRLGFDVPIGDASFYPNWGRLMPGCGADLAGQCSHSLAWELFSETIRVPGSFYGTLCIGGWPAIQARSCPTVGVSASMGGEPANNGAYGVYFLETNPTSPHGQGWRA